VYRQDLQHPHFPIVQVVCQESRLAALSLDNLPQATHFDSHLEATQHGNLLVDLNGLNDVAMSDHRVPTLLLQHSREKAS
jgi:hypothetical protein